MNGLLAGDVPKTSFLAPFLVLKSRTEAILCFAVLLAEDLFAVDTSDGGVSDEGASINEASRIEPSGGT